MYLIKLVMETIASLIFKKAAERSIKEILRRKSKRKTPSLRNNQKKIFVKNKKIKTIKM